MPLPPEPLRRTQTALILKILLQTTKQKKRATGIKPMARLLPIRNARNRIWVNTLTFSPALQHRPQSPRRSLFPVAVTAA